MSDTITVELYMATGSAGAIGFKRHQKGSQKGVDDTAKNVIWLPKSQIKIIDRDESKPNTWPRCMVQIPAWLASKRRLNEYN